MKTIGLLSYPKSGSNWITYIIETIANIECVGLNENYLIFGKNNCEKYNEHEIIKKFHGHEDNDLNIDHNFDSLILIIRNYIECIQSWRIDKENDEYSIKTDLEKDLIWYCNIIKYFDDFKKDKLLIYYTDLILNPKKNIKKLLIFLNKYNHNKYITFIQNIKQHIKNSREHHLYKNRSNKDVLFYKKTLEEETIKKMNNYIKNNYNDVFNKYLIRYKG